MSRNGFSWDQLDQAFLGSLANGLLISGDAAVGLENRFGSKPNEDFIREVWAILIDEWLQQDVNACVLIAKALRNRGVGDLD
jgi:hypothetical protein